MHSLKLFVSSVHDIQRVMLAFVVLGYLFHVVWARILLGQDSMFFCLI